MASLPSVAVLILHPRDPREVVTDCEAENHTNRKLIKVLGKVYVNVPGTKTPRNQPNKVRTKKSSITKGIIK